jgi:hypothetical protein
VRPIGFVSEVHRSVTCPRIARTASARGIIVVTKNNAAAAATHSRQRRPGSPAVRNNATTSAKDERRLGDEEAADHTQPGGGRIVQGGALDIRGQPPMTNCATPAAREASPPHPRRRRSRAFRRCGGNTATTRRAWWDTGQAPRHRRGGHDDDRSSSGPSHAALDPAWFRITAAEVHVRRSRLPTTPSKRTRDQDGPWSPRSAGGHRATTGSECHVARCERSFAERCVQARRRQWLGATAATTDHGLALSTRRRSERHCIHAQSGC